MLHMAEPKLVQGRGWDGHYVLVVEDSGELVYTGIVVDDRGNEAYLYSGRPPHKPGSTGRVYIRPLDQDRGFANGSCEFFPSVFGLAWAPAVSNREA